MKQRIFTTVLIIASLGKTYSQFTKQLEFDFSKGSFKEGEYFENGKLKPQPIGSFVVLKIINVNTFRWKVEVEGRSVNYVTPIPSELQTIFRLSDQTGDQQKTVTAVNNIQGAASTMVTVQSQVDSKKSDNPSNPTIKDLSVAMAELVNACQDYVALAQKIANIKFTRMELINISKQKWDSWAAMDEKRPASLQYGEMKKTYEDFSVYYAKAASKYSAALQAAKVNVAKLTATSTKDLKVATGSKTLLPKDEEYNKEINQALADLPQAQDEVTSIEDALKAIEDAHGDVYQDNFLSLVQDVVVLQDAMDNPAYFEVVSPPIQVDGDYVDFNIKTTPTKMYDLLPYDVGKTFPLELPVKGGLKVDFSVGPIFSVGNNARSDKYYFKSDSSLRRLDNKNTVSPGVAALMHFYSRRGKTTNYGGLFGVGAGFQSAQDANVSFYLGGSIVFGKQQKLMLNAGVSYLSVDRLKTDQYKEGAKYDSSKVNIQDVTSKAILPSFFFGISYNLTNKIEVK